MKTVLLVAKLELVRKIYVRELQKVFGDYLNVTSCLQDDESETPSRIDGIDSADLILITNPYSLPAARKQMHRGCQIVNMEFTFPNSTVEALKQFPDGTEALVCYGYYSVAQQVVNLLYESGITNLNLYIPYRENQNIVGKQFDLAISGWPDVMKIPANISQTIYLGDYKLSLTTLLDIAVKLNILDDKLEQVIADYCTDNLAPIKNISYFYEASSLAAVQLKNVMECVDYAVVIYSPDGRILNFNHNFIEFFKLPFDLYGQNIFDLSWETNFETILRSDRESENLLYHLRRLGRDVSVTKKALTGGMLNGTLYILFIKNVMDFTNIDNSLRKQAASHGHLAKYRFSDITYADAAMARCVDKARKIANVDKPTLVTGESGTGKELFAQAIHNASERANFPFVPINCAAIPSALLESELFGYADGAFTGARRGGKAGLFQSAHKGTLFLDEIGELSLATQAKLLRVLEEREIMKVGSDDLIEIDVRIIAATNRNLKELVAAGAFRLDLYYRLNTLIVRVPPLRERRRDIPILVETFLKRERCTHVSFEPTVWTYLMNYRWDGNVRELRNCVEYVAHISNGTVTFDDLPDYLLEEFDGATGVLTSDSPIRPDAKDSYLIFNILKLLSEKSMGRYGMREALLKRKIELSEYHLRRVLFDLNSRGYIVATKGRSGCKLTDAGRRLLSELYKKSTLD